jgi:hypothetical protein
LRLRNASAFDATPKESGAAMRLMAVIDAVSRTP